MIKRSIGVFIFVFFLFGISSAEEPKIVRNRGNGTVHLVQYDNGHWQMMVDGKPYLIKGVVYEPVVIQKDLHVSASNLWMDFDFNKNGKPDTAYDSWVDKNGNNKQDVDEPVVGDFQLLKEMGCNTIRLYHPVNVKKEVLRDLYNRYGIRVMMGNLFGAYTWGSGASWEKGTDYSDPGQRKRMLDDIRSMVLEYKDEPFILFWMLGNENDMPGSAENSTLNKTNAPLMPDTYAQFVNDAAKLIHELDPNHPVGASNALYSFLKYYQQYAPELDIVGMNAYRGPYGFGSMWNAIRMEFDRPVVVTEYGVDCWDQNKEAVDEDAQALYHQKNFRDMVNNSAGHSGTGNALGGFVYIWLDSWWLVGLPTEHDTKVGAWRTSSKDGWMNDEWMGICGQGDGTQSPFLRQLRKVYFMYKKEWGSNVY